MPASSSDPGPSTPAGLEVRPFRALTYRQRDAEHLARVSSPAYDLVTPEQRRQLATADPHNVVRLILPQDDHRPRPGADAEGTPAQQAARTLRAWLAESVLVRDPQDALWLYELDRPGAAPPTLGWLGAVSLPPAGSTAVLPHEDTYPRAVEGRRALLAATRTDLEPIVLAHDPEPEVAELAARARGGTPTLALQDADGVRHRLWRITDRRVLDALARAFRRTGAVIADGHHRFAAAQAHHRSAADVAGAGAVLALVTPMGPGGLRVEPIHRVVPELSMDQAIAAAEQGFRVRELPVDAAAGDLRTTIRRWFDSPEETGFLLTDARRLVALTDPAAEVRAAVPAEAPPAWRRLDVVLAHAGLLGRLWGRPDEPESVLIAHDVSEALRLAGGRGGVAVLLRAPSPGDVAAVARAGARMPRKSTLFVPKPRTGLVLRPLDD